MQNLSIFWLPESEEGAGSLLSVRVWMRHTEMIK